jgi:hypothetical protein
MSIKPIAPLPRDPRTPAEWKHAADLAYTLLAIEDCKMYGLVEGGPVIDIERCEVLIERAKMRGIKGKFNIALIRALMQ